MELFLSGGLLIGRELRLSPLRPVGASPFNLFPKHISTKFDS